MKSISIPPKLAVVIVVLVVAVLGFVIYDKASGPSPAEIERHMNEVHRKMMPRFPGAPSQPATPANTGK